MLNNNNTKTPQKYVAKIKENHIESKWQTFDPVYRK